MADFEYSIVCLKGCFAGSCETHKAIDRITKGPLDMCGGDGLHPIYMISAPEDYFLLEVEDWTVSPSRREYVGYCELNQYRVNDDSDRFCIRRFEIFREFRGKGYGSKFAKKLMKPWTYRDDEHEYSSVSIWEMDASSVIFWWNAVKKSIVDDVMNNIYNFEDELSREEKVSRLEAYLIRSRHDETVKRILKSLGDFMIGTEDWDTGDCIKHVEELEDYKRCKSHRENTRCHICFSFYPKLTLTGCGGNCHEEGCKYSLMCEGCCGRLVESGAGCPGRCREGALEKLLEEYVYSLE